MESPMINSIGLKVLQVDTLSKRDFFLFDQIAVPELRSHLRSIEDPSERAEIDWLIDSGLLADVPKSAVIHPIKNMPLSWDLSQVLGLTIFNIGEALTNRGDPRAEATSLLSRIGSRAWAETYLRRSALALGEFKKVSCSPILPEMITDFETLPSHFARVEAFINELSTSGTRIVKADVPTTLQSLLRDVDPDIDLVDFAKYILGSIQKGQFDLAQVQTPVLDVVLEAFPVPDNSANWEDILAFTRDEKTRLSALELRRWIRKVPAALPPAELREELEWLMASYSDHMRFHKIKSRAGLLQTMVTVAADAAEHIVKLQWGKLAGDILRITERNVPLLEAERDAPGREIAYIIKAREKFDGRGA
jgi:hypothetical protein